MKKENFNRTEEYMKGYNKNKDAVSAVASDDGLYCPKCKSKITIYGSECYPDEGMSVECDNLDCDMEVSLKINLRTNKLKIALKAAWNILAT